MVKQFTFLLLLLLILFFAFGFTESQSSYVLMPHVTDSFNVSYIQMNNADTCLYSLVISTSCSSPKYTRDQISIAFGDAYANQIYAPRLDDPASGTFESCSSDTFQISGPCAYQICYVYLYRSGYDGWKPESVRISGYNSRPVTFYYNTYIPSDAWYGFNLCNHASSSFQVSTKTWFICIVLGLFLNFWI
ncbi:hypothetical protein TanjilG_04654 [Lupinus angustifolius]|uniref:Uncharacterized protein n=1 Tax=Lupinus angustifolius TaxID=3871 RepID=A0A4P1RJU1_LUPAN|nr:PREDICTED: uncharacterized protein LOC109346824 isoform X1 [Lupinus angustifolius]OIW12490.1 hypothetical protein TanjilG_04654 [Lupinus angustifolius]